MKVKLTITYDGTNYCGWQVQPNGITVQQEIESALYKLTGENIKVVGSGRTDAGVHAIGQVAHFFREKQNIPAEKYAFALNAILPDDIKVIKSEIAPGDFDARKSAKKKTYEYGFYISETLLPLKERYRTWLERTPDLEKMKECAKVLIGEHDFKGFCASGGSAKTTVRTIYNIDIEKNGKELDFYITGNGFLYNMVRILVGTLIAVGNGKLEKTDIENMLKTGERSLGGKTLPAKGLKLYSVCYE